MNNVIILILLLHVLYDFEFENVEIKQTWNLNLKLQWKCPESR